MTGASRDAELFLTEAYREQPDGTVIAVGPLTRPHYVRGPLDAVPYVVGKANIFCRVTLLARRPAKGRGKDVDSIALPGLVGDLDVNGSPNGKGGTVTGAFDSVEHALELLHQLEHRPTLIVRSGYGVQAWWLLHQAELLRDDADRERVRAVAQAWQDHIRAQAGVEKVDGVADLSRLMRVPGSTNGKGSTPAAVVLMASDGPRYGLGDFPAPTVTSSGDATKVRNPQLESPVGRRAEELLDEFETLAKIVKHRGTRPKDTSPSGWDFMLCCRAIELGVTADGDLASLIRHHRSTLKDAGERAKGDRDDYVERTIANAWKTVGKPVEAHSEILPRLTRELRLNLAGLELGDVQVFGDDGLTKFIATDGSLMTFPRLADVAKPDRLADGLAASYGVATELSKLHARRVAGLVREYVGRARALESELLLAGWVLDVLQDAKQVTFTDTDPKSKAQAWQEMYTAKPSSAGPGEQAYAMEMIVAAETGTRDRYIRSGWLQEYIRRCGSKDSTGEVAERLRAIGLEQRGSDGQVAATDPSTGETRRLRFYIATSAWVELWKGRT